MTNAINSNKAYSKHSDRSTRLKCKISIRDRLSLLFGSLVFINLVAVGIGGIGLNRVRNSSPLINTIGSEQMLTYRLAYWANLRSKKTNSGERITIDVSIRDDIQNFETSLSAIHKGSKKLGLNPISDPKVLAQLEKVADAWQIYRQKIENYLMSSPQQEQEYLEQINNLTSFLTNLMDVTTRSVETQTADTAIQSQNLLLMALVLSLLSIPISLVVVSQIIHALTQVTVTADQMAKGELHIRAKVTSRDEVGVLASTLNTMAEQIDDLLRGLKVHGQELENALIYLSTIIDNLVDGLLVTDTESKIKRYNPALLTMFGLEDTDLANRDCKTLANSKVVELVEQTRRRFGEVFTTELELTNGRIGQAVARAIVKDAANTQDNNSLGSIILIRDITAEKEVDRMKTDFISTVSHELRTPLTSVLGFASIIQDKLEELAPQIDPEHRKAQRTLKQVQTNINIIVSEAERLTTLINDVLDVAKMEAGKVEWYMEPLYIGDVIERAIAATSSLFEMKGLELRKVIDPDLPLMIGDSDRLIQVMINLISNAVKFTERGHITCQAKIARGTMLLSITDTGIGIATDDKPKVFERFKQVGNTLTDKPKGTGLGLPICKQIVEHHGGRIWVESEQGLGSTFFFTLPLMNNVETEKLSINTLIKQLKEHVVTANSDFIQKYKTILVVDDDAHIRELLRQELETEGYKVREAKDGMDAIAQVKIAQPDLIILDVMMPQINGFEVAAVLKNNPQTTAIPIIILSIIEDKERGYRLGIDRYLTKPIHKEDLLGNIGVLLSQGVSQKKVLIVDTNASTLQTLSDVLQAQGYNVVEASDRQECIEKALAIQPDMIIVDSYFQEQHNLVKTLRFEKGMENVFFILLTDNHTEKFL
ncbi:hybrid sensor histidine kinase/response regulator [Scytonema hofmannii PCC 7110]|uniref:Circadian input-output histidine kinase CikA n=1 Tax=Scytonema hofmannii PCC 7110 TaxID=128403 RepID=A0A139WUP0_9CYAN|nr:response regulator [Scytonema hofmannii]KYC36155.1 hybrid sensor histidine kinase/response regulator [Scytonema hofmannii PCC 7110]